LTDLIIVNHNVTLCGH